MASSQVNEGSKGISWPYWVLCRFIQNYGKLAQPLTALTNKESQQQFRWTEQAQSAFKALKSAIVSTPVFNYAQFFSII